MTKDYLHTSSYDAQIRTFFSRFTLFFSYLPLFAYEDSPFRFDGGTGNGTANLAEPVGELLG